MELSLPMKRRRILLLLALAVVAAGLALFWPRGPREPVYQGIPLSSWLGLDPAETTTRHEAVRALGTNALPWLLNEFSSQVPTNGFRVGFNNWADRHTRVTFRFRIDRVRRAASALQMLGPAVTPALPELARYFGDGLRASDAVFAMAGAGELAIPWFQKALDSTTAEAEIAAVACLERLATRTAAAIPPLVQALGHSNDVVRRMAAWALDAPTPRPDLTVPALTAALADSNAEVRRWAAQGLGWRAQHAASALSALRRLMTDTNRLVAQEAGNAVFKIESAAPPSGAWKAGTGQPH